MDTNAGRFVEEERAEKWMQRIEVGEEIKIKGEECVVESIGDRTVTLKLLSADERFQRNWAAAGKLADMRRELLRERDGMIDGNMIDGTKDGLCEE